MTLEEIFKLNMSYDDFDKRIYKKEFIKILRNFAKKDLCLNKEDFDITFSEGGYASEGEAILHTDNIYISLAAREHLSPNHQVLYRTVKNRKDYTGGGNNFCSAEFAFGSGKNSFLEILQNLNKKSS